MDLKQYQTQTLVEVAYKALKKDITERVLLPGEKIILREVNERYGISATPIKQALNRLIAEGLVESTPRKGIRVRVIKGEEIAELMDIRLMIETYYLKRIIHSLNEGSMREKLLKNLTEQVRIIERLANIDDYFKYYSLDFEFHQMYIKCCKNKKILQIYNSLGTHGYAFYVYRIQEKESLIAGVKEHESIYNALAAQDENMLRKCIEIHITNAKNKISQMLKSKQVVF